MSEQATPGDLARRRAAVGESREASAAALVALTQRVDDFASAEDGDAARVVDAVAALHANLHRELDQARAS